MVSRLRTKQGIWAPLILGALYFLSGLAQAAWPLPEGLFRNASNADMTSNAAIVTFSVRPDEQFGLAAENAPAAYYKLIFTISGKDTLNMWQLRYSGPAMTDNQLEQIWTGQNLLRKLRNDARPERDLFYSMLISLVWNDSRAMAAYLKKYAKHFETNTELINPAKAKLVESYKHYLQAIKQNKELKQELDSPLNLKTAEDRTLVQELMTQGVYSRSKYVALQQRNGSFFWKLDLDNGTAWFTNEDKRFTSLELNLAKAQIVMQAGNYMLFDGIHELPKDLGIKFSLDGTGANYRIRLLSLETSANKNNRLEKLIENYRKILASPEHRREQAARQDSDAASLAAFSFLY